PFETPNILNDGVIIARDIDLEEPFANMGVQLVKEAAIRTNDMAGDGSTTATILAQAILSEGLKNIAAGANPMLLRTGLELGAEALVEEIKAMSKSIETHEEIAQVATIASGDPDIGEMIAEVLDQVGRDGIVMVEEGQGLISEIEYIKGLKFDRGYISPSMANDQEHMEAVLSNPAILITDKKITTITEMLPLLERVLATGKKEVLVIAEDIVGEALATLVVNKMRGTFYVLGVRAPSFGDRREAMMEDIAIMTGGRVISEKVGLRLEKATLKDVGTAHSVTTTKDSTLIVDGGGSKTAIQSRIRELRALLANGASDYDREKLQEKKLRMQDALSATRAALEEGVVPGGGAALVIALPALDNVKTKMPEEMTGVNILRRALEEPLRQIAVNAGYDGSIVVANVREKPFGYGFDATCGQYVDMFKAGIVDPVKVTRVALQNAVSIAALLLTTGALITDAPVYIPGFKDIEFGL
ncbi:MAG: chaperonin GroEL, partial [Chloroflexi bacterium]